MLVASKALRSFSTYLRARSQLGSSEFRLLVAITEHWPFVFPASTIVFLIG